MGTRIKLPRAEPLMIDGERFSLAMLFRVKLGGQKHLDLVEKLAAHTGEPLIRASDHYLAFKNARNGRLSEGDGRMGPVGVARGAPALIKNDGEKGGDSHA